jgi:hypothetical protein
LSHNAGVNRRINLAALLNAVIALATYAFVGWNLAGAPVAARNTARFSALMLALAVAVRFHPRWMTAYRTAFLSFVAAHGVHYGTVIAYHVLLRQLLNPMFIGIATGGFFLLLGAALTLTRMPRLHLLLAYGIWAGFVVALSSRLHAHLLPEAPIITLLAFAMIVHIANAWKLRARKMRSASA